MISGGVTVEFVVLYSHGTIFHSAYLSSSFPHTHIHTHTQTHTHTHTHTHTKVTCAAIGEVEEPGQTEATVGPSHPHHAGTGPRLHVTLIVSTVDTTDTRLTPNSCREVPEPRLCVGREER